MSTLDKITQVPIHLTNWAFIILILIAAPQVAGVRMGRLQVVSTHDAQMLAIAGFSLGLALNLAGAVLLFRKRAKLRRLCLQWCAVHTVFLALLLLVFYEYLHFDWLKEWLTWLSGRVGR